MTTTAFTFTLEDLDAARYAETIDEYLAAVLGGKGTADNAIWSLESEFNPSFEMFENGNEDDCVFGFADAKRRGLLPAYRERFLQEIVTPRRAQYQRGREVLKTAKIVSSARTTLESRRLIDELAAAHDLVSPIVLVSAGHIGTMEAARYIALARREMMKERTMRINTFYTALQDAARRLLEETQTDVTQQVCIAPLARQLAESEQCSIDQARRALTRAVRTARGAQVPSWGGEREGAGVPTTALLRAGAEALVTLNGQSLGSGTIAVTRDGSIRIAIIELARGGELRIAVEKD